MIPVWQMPLTYMKHHAGAKKVWQLAPSCRKEAMLPLPVLPVFVVQMPFFGNESKAPWAVQIVQTFGLEFWGCLLSRPTWLIWFNMYQHGLHHIILYLVDSMLLSFRHFGLFLLPSKSRGVWCWLRLGWLTKRTRMPFWDQCHGTKSCGVFERIREPGMAGLQRDVRTKPRSNNGPAKVDAPMSQVAKAKCLMTGFCGLSR